MLSIRIIEILSVILSDLWIEAIFMSFTSLEMMWNARENVIMCCAIIVDDGSTRNKTLIV